MCLMSGVKAKKVELQLEFSAGYFQVGERPKTLLPALEHNAPKWANERVSFSIKKFNN